MDALRLGLTALSLACLLAACGGDETSTTTTAPATQDTTTTVKTDPVGPPPAVKLSKIASLDRPTALAQREGDDSLYVAEKSGVIRTVKAGVVDSTPVLDIRADTSDDGERGLLGLAFAPKSNTFYIDHTDKAGDTHIVEYKLDNGGRADLRTRREILFVKQPYANHNGGQLAFGPDGFLYIAFGDGGSAGDPQKNAQNLSVLLGKILRIKPDLPSNGLPYTIPFDNPFVKQTGARGEIWAYGLRNPWRFSFDKEKQGIWIADVGQNKREEIDHLELDRKGGTNYGWPLREGSTKYDGDPPKGSVGPVYDYDRSDGACSVTGGYVYRGKAIPDLTGRYLFGDFCTGKVSTLTERGSGWQADDLKLNVPALASFGEDHNGELYTLSQSGDVSMVVPA